MRVFEKPGPVNTDETIEIVKTVSSEYRYLVVASITGECAVRIAERIHDTTIICVTCPQGMGWEVDQMQSGPFADIPELQKVRDEWEERGLSRVPMQITPENRL